ncbi:urease subunit beta [Anabaena subtropica]|uniref:Urease subunit beta n=1 Tax=Anabaena subtropica FACHB-260 TaxID=2692884 RepID=A0ABR8CNK8_9NOST|nr:urease subunit beta [Anabaena subtropica FACHB-260]
METYSRTVGNYPIQIGSHFHFCELNIILNFD